MSRRSKRAAAPEAPKRPNRWAPVLVVSALVLGNLALFGDLRHYDFSSLDDPFYLTDNAAVKAGLTWQGVKWAFTFLGLSYWQPLTFLSHMLGWELFGSWAGGHHEINLALHIINSILTFLVLRRLTGALWRSAAVAALFAFHPLHVETVAWLANRQELLACLFWLFTIWAYAWYVERPSVRRYAAVVLAFALGLMCKPMVVTLPVILLALDYWPLQRSGWKRLVLEKAPLLLLALPVVLTAYVAEQNSGAMGLVGDLGVWERLANAAVAYPAYLLETAWPSSLAVLYPFERHIALWKVAGALLLLAGGAWAAARTRYATSGCLWFAIGLLPTIGLVQVGFQARADRYTYIPLTGLFVAIVWGLNELSSVRRWMALGLIPLWIASAEQVRYWRSDLALFERAVAVTGENPLAQSSLGQALAAINRYGEAIPHYREALRLNPRFPECQNNLGIALFNTQDYQEALAHFDRALQLDPTFAKAAYNRGETLRRLNRDTEALAAYEAALKLRLEPQWFREAHSASGNILTRTGRPQEALSHFQQALSVDPQNPEVRRDLAITLYLLGREQDAGAASEGLGQQRLWEVHSNAGNLFVRWGRPQDAVRHFERAVSLDPANTGSRRRLAAALTRLGRRKEADAQLKAVAQIQEAGRQAER